MNGFVLRGFCKKCKTHIEWLTKENYTDCPKDFGQCVPVWFLSPKQIKILLENKHLWREWSMSRKEKTKKTWKPHEGYGEQVATLLEEMPFLVAKILKDAGEKSKEENK